MQNSSESGNTQKSFRKLDFVTPFPLKYSPSSNVKIEPSFTEGNKGILKQNQRIGCLMNCYSTNKVIACRNFDEYVDSSIADWIIYHSEIRQEIKFPCGNKFHFCNSE
jgi:hypothetical protein